MSNRNGNARRRSRRIAALVSREQQDQHQVGRKRRNISPASSSRRRSQRLENQKNQVTLTEPQRLPEPPSKKRKLARENTLKTKIQERMERALNERNTLIHIHEANDTTRVYVIHGQYGQVYYVTIAANEKLKCTCLDSRYRGYSCKHVLFTFLRVLQVAAEHPCLQRGPGKNTMKASEFRTIMATAPSDPPVSVEASLRVKLAYEEKTGNIVFRRKKVVRREIEKDEKCPICLNCLEDATDPQAIVYCKYSCGRSMHKDCFARWCDIRKRSNIAPSCVFCRNEWSPESTFKKRRAKIILPEEPSEV